MKTHVSTMKLSRGRSGRGAVGALLGLSLVIHGVIFPFSPNAAVASTGFLTIVATGGVAAGNGWTHSDGVVSVTSNVSVNWSSLEAVVSSTSNSLTVNAAEIRVSASENGFGVTGTSLTLKASGSIRFDPQISLSLGGNLTLQADTDDSKSGEIQLGTVDGSGAGTISAGGDISLVGGSNGMGFAWATDVDTSGKIDSAGVALFGTYLTSYGGDILVRGASKVASQSRGVLFSELARVPKLSTTGSGTVTVEANASEMEQSSRGIVSTTAFEVVTQQGDILIAGIGNASDSSSPGAGLNIAAKITSTSGDVRLEDRTVGSNHDGVYSADLVLTTGGNVSLKTDKLFKTPGKITVDAETFKLEAYSTPSFQAATKLGRLILKGTPTSVIGHPDNTANLILDQWVENDGTVIMNTTGSITQELAGFIRGTGDLAFGSTGSVNLENLTNYNDVNKIAGGSLGKPLGSINFIDVDDLEIGTVGSLSGIYSSDTVYIATSSKDLNVTQPVTSTKTSGDSLKLLADRDATKTNAGDGDINVSGSGSFNIDPTSRALLYSGDAVTSTGLVDAVGGPSFIRTSVDATTTTFDPALLTSGKYALFRTSTPPPAFITTSIPTSAIYGETKTFRATSSSDGTVALTTSTPEICTISDGVSPDFSVEMVGVGTCTITHTDSVSVGGASNVVSNITVAQKALTVSGLTADKAYDQTTSATITGTPALVGVIGSDDVTVSGSATSGTFSSAAIGTRTVTFSGLTLSGTKAANYTVTQSISAEISKRPLTATFATVPTKVYDGIDSVSLTSTDYTLTGVIAGETVAISNTSGTLDSANIGTRTLTVATPTLTGAQAANYSLAGPVTGTATISAKQLTLGGSFTAANKFFDGTTSATTDASSLTLVGLIAGETNVAIDSLTAVFANSAIANGVTVTITAATLSGSQAGNYAVSLTGAPTATANITSGPTSAPTNVIAQSTGPTSATLTWVAPTSLNGSAITGYKIEASSDSGGTWTVKIADTATTTVSASVTNLIIGGTYIFRVSAINGAGTSAASAATQALSLATAPGAPSNLQMNFEGSGARISWSAPSDNGGAALTGYVVQYQTSGSWVDLTASGTSASIPGVFSTQSVSFRVAATNAVGQGVFVVFTYSPPPSYSGPVVTGVVTISSVQATGNSPIELSGQRLDEVLKVTVDGKELKILTQTAERLVLELPELTAGTKNLVITLKNGSTLIQQDALVVSDPPVTSEQAAPAKVNAGSFKGYVALYAKGHEGKRFSAKVGKDWVVVNSLASNFERITDFTGAGFTISVRIYIDRELIDTITVTTK